MGAKAREARKINGWMLVDKPAGISAAAVVAKVKRALMPSKIGHAGTLDPFATGLLPLALGNATKTVPFLMQDEKSYEFTINWEYATDSLDKDGQQQQISTLPPPSLAEIEAVLPQFLGRITQTPPAFSALKINGKRAYALARAGTPVIPQPREITIYDLWVRQAEHKEGAGAHDFCFVCRCSKGTYIRSLVRDIGAALGRFCHASSLRRTKIGKFDIADAILLEAIENIGHKQGHSALEASALQSLLLQKGWLLPIESVLDGILAFDLRDDEVVMLKNGRLLSMVRKCDYERIKGLSQGQEILLRDMETQTLLGWGQYKAGQIKPTKRL